MSAIRFFSTIAGTTDEVRVTAGWSSRRGVFYMDVQTVGKEPIDLLRVSLTKGQEMHALTQVLNVTFGILAPHGFWERVGLRKTDDDFEFTSEGKTPALCAWCKESSLIPGIIFPIASDGDASRAFVERCDDCALVTDDVAAVCILSHYLRMPFEYSTKGRPFIKDISFDDALKLKPQPYKR